MVIVILRNLLLSQLVGGVNLGQLVVLEVSALIGMRPFLTNH